MKADSETAGTELAGGGRNRVLRLGEVVHREIGPWAETVHALLRHLEAKGFAAAPRVVGSGFDDAGLETLSYIEGQSVHPYPWPEDALPALGAMLRRLHDATRDFAAPQDARWRPWFGRALGRTPRIIGHCDLGAWNIIAREGHPVALIDWEAAGPVDPLFELAQLCWLNALLFDDDLAEKLGLATAETRAGYVRAIAEGYGATQIQRSMLVDAMTELAVADAANEAIEGRVTEESEDAGPLWAITWRTRSAAWMLKNRRILENALA